MFHDYGGGVGLTDDQKRKAKGLAWKAFSRLVVAAAGTMGTGLARAALNALLPKEPPKDDDDEDEDDEDDE